MQVVSNCPCIPSIPKDHFNDDVLHFNTQVSTQWDGLRHYPYQNYPSQGEFR
jgi:hypothetical protein